jgi:hypothetical protein
LRAEDGQPATFFVGERFPVSLSTFSASLTSGSSTGSPISNPLTNYATGNTPSFILTDNLRGKGVDDLLVANSADNTISVLLGNGDGTFGTQTTFATGLNPVWIATGQFNNASAAANADAALDVAVANKGANTVSILLGDANADGGLQPKVDIPTGQLPVSVVSSDFHDHTSSFTDLAVVNQGDNTISIFQGNGDGTFKAPTLLQLPAGFMPAGLAASDLNGDGHTDLVVADQGHNTMSVFLGNGDGTFQRRTDYSTGNAPVFVAIKDLNNDGAPDIVVANSGAPTANNTGNSVSIYYNQLPKGGTVPTGTFVSGTSRDFDAGAGPAAVAIADYNQDGLPDIAVADKTDNAVTILLNEGSQLFAGLPAEIPVGTAPASIVTADFNADGVPDAAVADSGSAEATVILNSRGLLGSGNLLNSAGTPYPGIEFLDIGLKVKATARIHPDRDVTLQLDFAISSLSTQSFNAIPVVNNESISQTVRLKQNETAALAGFMQAQLTNAITGNPGIGEVPAVGALDDNQNMQHQNSEVLILVTPRLVRLAPRKDHQVYAGQGSLEGPGGIENAAPVAQPREEGRPPGQVPLGQPAPQPGLEPGTSQPPMPPLVPPER